MMSNSSNVELDDEYYVCQFTREQNLDDLDNELDENIESKNNRNKNTKGKTKSEETYKESSKFLPFCHKYNLHEASPTLPRELSFIENPTPFLIFSLFFPQSQLETIVINTNIYAAVHGAKQGTNQKGEGRNWTSLIVEELKIWLALVIYMGIFKFPAVQDYWVKDSNYPSHEITKLMSLLRFQQIKRFLHISDCTKPLSDWFSKVEPIASHIRNVSKQLYLPASNVSVDEMIARFSGRSGHTFRIKNKPTPEGYKILSLSESGYTYTFMFCSRITKSNINPISNVNKIGSEVYHLVQQLPQKYAFNIYMDNFFSSVNLFQFLREKGIGACGTVRTNTAKFPIILKKEKEKKNLEWDHLIGVVIEDVLALLWIDNGPVTMLSTIHVIDGENSRIERERRKPRETSTNSNKIKGVFGNNSRKTLPIPVAIDDYNYNMGGVDVADQLRSYYSTQLTVFRTWVPLFFWLLDTAIINSYLISKKLNIINEHKAFRLVLIRELIKNSLKDPLKRITRSEEDDQSHDMDSKKKLRVSSKFELPLGRLIGDDHYPEYSNKREGCLFCRFLIRKNDNSSQQNPPQSQIWCSSCKVALCCNKVRPNCFKEFHIYKE